jgi:hypothetical protein
MRRKSPPTPWPLLPGYVPRWRQNCGQVHAELGRPPDRASGAHVAIASEGSDMDTTAGRSLQMCRLLAETPQKR